MSSTKVFEKVWYTWLIYRRLPWSVALCARCASGDLETLFFGIWQIWATFFWWEILCIGWNYSFKVEIWENFPKTKTLVWRIGYTRIWKALGRIASTVFFCGEFLSVLRNVFVKNWKCSSIALKNGIIFATFSKDLKNLKKNQCSLSPIFF